MAEEPKSSKKTSVVGDLARSFNPTIMSDLYSHVIEFLSGTRSFYVLLIIGMLTVFGASVAGLDAVRIGYRHAYGVTREITWGLIISTYIFFVVTSTGLCIVSSIGHVFGVKNFMPIVNRAVFLSVVTIFAGFTVIFFDIENPFRMAIWNAISPNLTSNLWWMGTLYGAYMVFMAVEYVLLLLNNHKLATYAGLAGLISGIVAHSNLGAIFGMLHSREYWYGPFMPIYFIASAVMSGCAAVLFFTWVGYKVNNEKMDKPMERSLEAVSKLTILMISVLLFFTAWKVITGLVGAPGKQAAVMAMLAGPYAVNFWIFEVMLGMVIPFVLILYTRFKNINANFVASIMMILGIFFMRYDLVIVGQIVPAFHEMGINDLPHLLPYMPSFHEIMITIGGMGIVASAFLIGERVFKGHKDSGSH
jgi:molybdopterin-containing oxidoreductase family membrane subunit